MLALEGVSAAYGPVRALHDVTLHVPEGQVVTLLGANGAGKTTTLRTISGLLRPTSGIVRFRGRPIQGLAPEAIARMGIVQVPEGRGIFRELTVAENLRVGGHVHPEDRRQRETLERVLSLFPVLRERASQPAGTLSGGEQQMLAIGRALMARPLLLVMDEPSAGLDPRRVAMVFETVRRIHREGVTILLVEQNARQALQVAHQVYVLETGRMVLQGPAVELARDPRVQAAYLGGAPAVRGRGEGAR